MSAFRGPFLARKSPRRFHFALETWEDTVTAPWIPLAGKVEMMPGDGEAVMILIDIYW